MVGLEDYLIPNRHPTKVRNWGERDHKVIYETVTSIYRAGAAPTSSLLTTVRPSIRRSVASAMRVPAAELLDRRACRATSRRKAARWCGCRRPDSQRATSIAHDTPFSSCLNAHRSVSSLGIDQR